MQEEAWRSMMLQEQQLANTTLKKISHCVGFLAFLALVAVVGTILGLAQ
jgi:hypothetical protein